LFRPQLGGDASLAHCNNGGLILKVDIDSARATAMIKDGCMDEYLPNKAKGRPACYLWLGISG
jgi:hypothetical protein